MWLEGRMREDLTNKEILALMKEKFTWISGIKVQNIGSYRKKYVPNYTELILQRRGLKSQELPEDIEEEILKEVREAEEGSEEFSKAEQQKINMLKAFRVVLKEAWENYRVVKPSKDETAKKNYLETIMKTLTQIIGLEAAEKDFLSSMAEIRKAELKMTSEQYLDSIKGWWLLRCFEKAATKESVLKIIDDLNRFMEIYKQMLEKSETVEECNRQILENLYVEKKTRGE